MRWYRKNHARFESSVNIEGIKTCFNASQTSFAFESENRLDERLKQYAKYKVLIIDEIGYLPTSLEGANLFFSTDSKKIRKTFNDIYNK